MDAEDTNKKDDKAKSANSGCGPMSPGMFEMMSGCCTGPGGSPDCSTVMKGMMEKMRSRPCCSPGIGDTGSERREK
jgi:hypothetical protein